MVDLAPQVCTLWLAVRQACIAGAQAGRRTSAEPCAALTLSTCLLKVLPLLEAQPLNVLGDVLPHQCRRRWEQLAEHGHCLQGTATSEHKAGHSPVGGRHMTTAIMLEAARVSPL